MPAGQGPPTVAFRFTFWARGLDNTHSRAFSERSAELREQQMLDEETLGGIGCLPV
jgi:hypothetical protein